MSGKVFQMHADGLELRDESESFAARLDFSPYQRFSRDEWAELAETTSVRFDDLDLSQLAGLNERLSMDEVRDIYLPMAQLLNMYVKRSFALHEMTGEFLQRSVAKVPFIIGLAGSVAVGKSTTGRVLEALLQKWPEHPRVDLVNTDGFLLPNAELEARGIMNRKGFPESYDSARLLNFLADIKAGRRRVEAPQYSHFFYDVMPDQKLVVDSPDILIVEGLNVLQPARLPKDGDAVPFVSDFFDFSLYIDAAVELIERWYVERFMRLRQTAFRDPAAYFHRYSLLDEDAARNTALEIWTSINKLNLEQNILPTRGRADLVVTKGKDHAITTVDLRRL